MARHRAVFALAFVVSATIAGAQPRPPALSGLTAVDVQLTIRRECPSVDTTTLEAVRIAVRRTGILVTDTARAVLGFEVRCSLAGQGGAVAIGVHAMLVELVAIPRLGGGPDYGAATWQGGAAELATRATLERGIRSGIAAAIDAFERDLRSANPRRRQPETM